MRPEFELLFACTRQDFLPEHEQKVRDLASQEKLDWGLIFHLAREHGVAPLIYRNLLLAKDVGLEIPEKTAYQFKIYAARNIKNREKLTGQITEVLAFLNSKSVDVMLLKGAALDLLVYEQPWWVRKGDVDLLLRSNVSGSSEDGKEEIQKYLRKLCEKRSYYNFEPEFNTHHDITVYGLPIDFEAIWLESKEITYEGQQAFVMAPEDLLMASCHGCYMKNYWRLQSLLDISEIIKSNPKLDWDVFVYRVRQSKSSYIVYSAIYLTKITLGVTIPNQVMTQLSNSEIRKEIVRRRMNSIRDIGPSLDDYSTSDRVKRRLLGLFFLYASLPFKLANRRLINYSFGKFQ